MVITITPEIEELVNEQVKSGDYSSPSEVLLESLRLLKAHREEIHELRRKIQIGVEAVQQGRFVTLKTDADVEEFTNRIIRQAEEKSNHRESQNAGTKGY